MTVSEPPSEAVMRMSAPMRLYRIELTVVWNEKRKDVSARFETLRAVSEVPARDVPSPGGDS
jgi:hypothetical protein